jgi:hypothetical protein
MDESSIRIPFRWYNSFGSRSRNGPVSSSRLPFEQAHVLFNIGAMYNQLGRQAQSQQQSDGGERIKKAAFYYQMASGVFQEVIERYREELGAMGSREMAPAALMAFGALNLALAQECFCQKAIQGTISRCFWVRFTCKRIVC